MAAGFTISSDEMPLGHTIPAPAYRHIGIIVGVGNYPAYAERLHLAFKEIGIEVIGVDGKDIAQPGQVRSGQGSYRCEVSGAVKPILAIQHTFESQAMCPRSGTAVRTGPLVSRIYLRKSRALRERETFTGGLSGATDLRRSSSVASSCS